MTPSTDRSSSLRRADQRAVVRPPEWCRETSGAGRSPAERALAGFGNSVNASARANSARHLAPPDVRADRRDRHDVRLDVGAADGRAGSGLDEGPRPEARDRRSRGDRQADLPGVGMSAGTPRKHSGHVVREETLAILR